MSANWAEDNLQTMLHKQNEATADAENELAAQEKVLPPSFLSMKSCPNKLLVREKLPQ